ncbi:MAG: hypothetical protein ACLTC4_21910 [Hungatella hathewayi]
MEKHYYNQLLQGDGGALKRALYKSMGFTDESLSKPLIAIVNTYTNATPGHYGIDELCKQAERMGGRRHGYDLEPLLPATGLRRDMTGCATFYRREI